MKYLINRIQYIKYSIMFYTNDVELLDIIKDEYKEIFQFEEYMEKVKDEILSIKAIKSIELYNKYFNIVKNNNSEKSNIYCQIRRNNIILIDKEKKEISILYDKLNDEKICHVEEIVIGILGKYITDDGFRFIRAMAVEKNKKGIAIIGNENTRLILKMLQKKFNYIATNQLGVKIINNKIIGISFPIRIGLRADALKSPNILDTQIYKKMNILTNLNNKLEKNNENLILKIKDMQQIFKTKFIQETEIKVIFKLCYVLKYKGIKIVKAEDSEKKAILEENLRDIMYQPVHYIKNVFKTNEFNKNFNMDKLDIYKVYLDYESINEFIDLLNRKIS